MNLRFFAKISFSSPPARERNHKNSAASQLPAIWN